MEDPVERAKMGSKNVQNLRVEETKLASASQ
jgi:hypothetical protein